jgi:hypothetical protein
MALLFRLPLLLIEALLRRLFRGGEEPFFVPEAAPRDTPGAGAAFTAPAATDAAAATAATPGAPASTMPPPPRAPRAPAAAPPPIPEPPTPTAEEAIQRRFAREAAAPPPPPPPPAPSRAKAPPPPLRAVGEDDGHVDVEVEVVESFGPASDVGSALTVDEPWSGYDGQPASAIASRVRSADTATKAVVRLYEQQHKKRATVLRATG